MRVNLNYFNSFFNIIFLKSSFINVNIINIDIFNILLKFLKYSTKFLTDVLLDIFVTDYLYFKKRFRVCHNFSSSFENYNFLTNNSVYLLESYVSISNMYKSCIWVEREVYDMFGIKFINNWDLRKILTDYTFFGFPLRKDFPLSGYLELIFDLKKRVTSETLIELMQEMRFFSISSGIEIWDFIFNEEV